MTERRRFEWLFELGQKVAGLEGRGETLDVLVIEGSQPAADGSHVLSHWAVTPFVIEGVCYRTLTHFLMAARAQVFGSPGARLRILRSREPAEAERWGYAVRGGSESTWASLRGALLTRGNLSKALQNHSVRQVLFGSNEAVIASAGVSERVMGTGLPRDDPRMSRPGQWQGLNLLGLALMDVRALLRRGGLQVADPS